MRSFRTASSLLATAVLVLAGACSEPELKSDLVTEGPPEVVEVNVLSEGSLFAGDLRLGEAATFCRVGDEYKVNNDYCPLERDESNKPIAGARETAPVMDATPYALAIGNTDLWHVRIIFDELLDPSVEDLVTTDGVTIGTLEETQPVELRCGGADVPYDGFYDPSGNHLSYPPGPALVIQTLEFVRSGTADCEVEIKAGAVVDKDGNEVLSDQLGPYTFGIAPLSIYGTDPTDSGDPEAPVTGVDPEVYVTLNFSAPVDLATVAAHITFEDEGGTPVPFTVTNVDPLFPEDGPIEYLVFIVPNAPLDPLTTYVVTIASVEGDAIADTLGGEAVLFDPVTGEVTDTNTITFVTGEAL